ncbi:MAG: hypothetical protein V4808_01735 [Pseudomonadota bacterium]
MTASEQRTYTISLHGNVADYTVAPLADALAAKYVEDIASFHEHSMESEDDGKPDGLTVYSDYPEAEHHSGLFVGKGSITVEDDTGSTVYEAKLEDINDELDWDDYVTLEEATAYGLARSCAVFSLPTDQGGTVSYEIQSGDDFDIGQLMLVASQFDEDGWFISKLYYDGSEPSPLGSSGRYDLNKSTIVHFPDGSFDKAASHVVDS